MLHDDALTHRAKIEAAIRTAAHDGLPSQRKLSEGFEIVGVFGEIEFAVRSGLPLPLDQNILSDGGVDFIVPLRFTLDVKTACKAFNLIQEVGKVTPDIYVLAEFNWEGARVRLVGREWGAALRQAPTRDFGHGLINHFIPAFSLRPMAELFDRIVRVR